MAGANFSCALRANGSVECWGSSAPSLSNQHKYIAISGNSQVLCVLRDDAKGGCVQDAILQYVEYGLILLTQTPPISRNRAALLRSVPTRRAA